MMAVLATLMSTQIRIPSPTFFGTMTKGFTQVGCFDTGSMMSSSSSFSSSVSSCCCIRIGSLLLLV